MTENSTRVCHASVWEHYEFAYCRFHRNNLAIAAAAARGPPLHHLGPAELPVPQGMKDLGMTPPPLYDFAAAEKAGPPKKNRVLKAGRDHLAPSGQACYEACVAEAGCEFWVWCPARASGVGCDDGGEWGARFPAGACELMALEPGLAPVQWDRGPAFSTFESGYLTGEGGGEGGCVWASGGSRLRSVVRGTARPPPPPPHPPRPPPPPPPPHPPHYSSTTRQTRWHVLSRGL